MVDKLTKRQAAEAWKTISDIELTWMRKVEDNQSKYHQSRAMRIGRELKRRAFEAKKSPVDGSITI
jgi:hypothetical protein